MFSPHDITKIEKRCGWLRHWFYEPVQDLTVTMATSREHIRHLAVDHLQFWAHQSRYFLGARVGQCLV